MTEHIKAILDDFSMSALNNRTSAYNSYELAKRCIDENIQGDFVECGVYAGVQCAAMALALEGDRSRTIHLFDSFQGIPQARAEDEEPFEGHETTMGLLGKSDRDGILKTTGVAACPIESAKQNMQQRWGFSNIPMKWYEGWFENTVPLAKIDKIAILRLDGDLYSSTQVCLEYLAPLVSKGGYIIIDDGFSGVQKAVREYWKKAGIAPVYEKAEGAEWPRYWRVA